MAKEKILERGCDTCHFLTGCVDASGRRVIRESKGYQCSYPIPEIPIVPESFSFLTQAWQRRHYDHKTKTESFTPARAQMVWKGNGKTCPTWKAWK